jgi:hypothetical protein
MYPNPPIEVEGLEAREWVHDKGFRSKERGIENMELTWFLNSWGF